MAALPHDQEHLEEILTHAIASAFKGCVKPWTDDTSGDRLAGVAARAVSRQLIEAGLKVRHADAGGGLTARQHRLAAEQVLSEASFCTSDGVPTTRAGYRADIKRLQLLVARARVHALLAALPEEER